MKHEEITQNTKKTLSESLKKAMKKKPFKKITISELIQDCDMNRKTFYYHFENIYDLLKWTLEQEAINVVKHFDLLVDYEEAINFVMDYVESNEYILNCAYDSIGREELKRFFSADFLEIVVSIIDRVEAMTGKSLETDYKDFLSRFYMEAITGMLIDWIKNRDQKARDVVIRYISTTIRESLIAIVGSGT